MLVAKMPIITEKLQARHHFACLIAILFCGQMDFQPSNQSLPPPNTSELSTINPECYSDVEEALDCGGQSRGEYSSVDGGRGDVEVNHGGDSCYEWGDMTGGDGGMGNNFQKGGAEVNDDDLKKKRRCYGRNQSLCHKKYRRDAKTVSSNAVKATFIRPLNEGTTLSGTDKQKTIQLRIKSLCNQKNYKMHKHQQTKASVASLKHEIEQLNAQCKSHEDINAQQSIKIAKAEMQREKLKQILEKRMERWSM